MTTPTRFRAFLFDLDGTLIDHFEAIHRSYVHTLGRMGLPVPTAEQVRRAVGGGLEKAMLRFVPPERLQEGLAIYRPYWDRTMLDDVRLMPGARELLERLKAVGARLGVMSNKVGGSSRLICGHLGITPYLDAILGAGDTKWMKPSVELSRYALGLLGAKPEETVMVGDSPYDVEAGHVGGFPAWCVTTGTHTREQLEAAGADRVFADFGELGRAVFGG
jgi:phosphoglycolate phosphatase-like HAD superfamily hydrolase